MSDVLADAHLHLFRQGFPATRGGKVLGETSEIEGYEALRQAHRIAAGLVIGYEADGIDPENNSYIRTLATARPWMATLAYVPAHPTPTVERLDAHFESGHVGLAVYLPNAEVASTFAAWSAESWRRLERRGAILSLNARPEAIRELKATVKRHAGCSFLFSHLGLPGRYAVIPTAAEAVHRLQPLIDLADCPNARVKISGLYAVSDPPAAHPHDAAKPFVELLLDRIGPDRCLWASDFSPALEFVSFAQTASIPWLERLGPEERHQVMGRNLLRLLGRGNDS